MDNNSEEQILAEFKRGRTEAFEELVRLYTPKINRYSTYYYAEGLVRSDLFQEGCIGLYVAVQKYHPSKGSAFRTFAGIHIKNYIINAVKAAKRYKHSFLNESLSLDAVTRQENEERALIELIPSRVPTPEEIVLQQEQDHERTSYVQGLMKTLTVVEREVFHQFLDGYTYKEAAKKIGISCKSVDNAFHRVKKKIKKTSNPLKEFSSF